MQLFSIGLWKLNMDGSQQRGGDGAVRSPPPPPAHPHPHTPLPTRTHNGAPIPLHIALHA